MLSEKFPAAEKLVGVEPSMKEFTKANLKIDNYADLTMYLEDVQWKSQSAALMERVLYERPKNVPAFLIELLVKGDVAPAGPEELSDDLAATKMQAASRGRKARKSTKAKRQQAEVTVPTAADADEQVDSYAAQQAEAADEAAAKAVMDEDAAATKMQAIQRGKNARR